MTTHSSLRKSILVLSASLHLNGNPVSLTISTDWSKPSALPFTPFFENVPFDIDPADHSATLNALNTALESRRWDGVLIGWCVRGHAEFTELFEEIVGVCVRYVAKEKGEKTETKIMFSTGPNNLVETVVRNFPVDGA
jgi:hypothetical protein